MDDGERLRCLREAAGFASPGKAAPVIGCSRTYLWRLENGRAPVSHVGACHLSGMAKAYGVSEATILGRVPGAEAALDSLSIIRIPVLGTIPGVDPGVLEGTVDRA
mgnify:CR=1 FL=1